MEFQLLERLGGYRREDLKGEPALVVRRWMIILEEEAALAERLRLKRGG